MRLWASRFSYTLNDHGLFKRDTRMRVMEARTEREVFERLGLEYRNPEERDCFDAVVPLGSQNKPFVPDIEKSDFFVENEQVWID